MLSFLPLDVLNEIWDVIESFSEGFLTYSHTISYHLSTETFDMLIIITLRYMSHYPIPFYIFRKVVRWFGALTKRREPTSRPRANNG